MTDNRREAGGDSDDERRPHRDRDPGNNPWAESYDRLWAEMLKLGVDIHKEEDVAEWNADLEWVRERRKRGKRWQSVRGQLAYIGAGSIVTGAVGWIISWLNSHFSGGGHQ